jgi:hypothetical protein
VPAADVNLGNLGRLGRLGKLGNLGRLGRLGKVGKIGKLGGLGKLGNLGDLPPVGGDRACACVCAYMTCVCAGARVCARVSVKSPPPIFWARSLS